MCLHLTRETDTTDKRKESPVSREPATTGSTGSDSSMSPHRDSEMAPPGEISKELCWSCTTYESVTLLLASDPTLTPAEAWKRLYKNKYRRRERRELEANGEAPLPETLSGLDRIAACGKWGKTRPSELFLKMYRDALLSIDEDLEQAVVSPSLMGASGTLPLTIISTIPDICRHMSNLIVRADKEVFLATNYWQSSVATKFITDALRELSRRVTQERAGAGSPPVVVKIMYDRGSVKQALEPHLEVPEKEYTGPEVLLPPPSEIPGVELQVVNFHQPLLGTFHAKFMVVDRRVALVQSNNIQDNANLEMAVQLEGPIVDSVYDMALISWSRGLGNGLPMIGSPAAAAEGSDAFPSWTQSYRDLFDEEGRLRGSDVVMDPARMKWSEAYIKADAPGVGNGVAEAGNGKLEKPVPEDPSEEVYATPLEAPADSNGVSRSSPASSSLSPPVSLPEHTHVDPHYDVDLAGEILRVQAKLEPKPDEDALAPITRKLNHTRNPSYVVPDSKRAPTFHPWEQMTPYIAHPVHEPVPMAMVNRPPYGPVNHRSVRNPQNESWLSALRHAQKNVFIQSPTLNAEPLIPAIVEACDRGVDVYCYICISYNDTGELLPLQGGHNEAIPPKLLSQMSPEGAKHLHYFWYVARDHDVPIVQTGGKRACHIKLLIADEKVGIVGSGNQDTQSWYQSQEMNVMVDSPELCRSWIDGLRRNQNTEPYGRLGADGIWRDGEGKEVEGSMGVDPGRFSWAKGLVGAVRRVQGKGGFG